MSDIRAVIDTSVVVSAALLPRSVPRRAVDLARTRGRILISADTLDEVDGVLRRPKFNQYVSEERRLEFLASLVQVAEVVEVTIVVLDCRDERDNKFLELAVSGSATHLISGDADLLDLNPFRGIAILTPQAFLKMLQPDA
jgi:putative PIN family toxin of toxin-antitoxin system